MATGITTLITDDTNERYEYAPEIGDGWVVYHGYFYDGATVAHTRSSPTNSPPAIEHRDHARLLHERIPTMRSYNGSVG